MISKMIEKYVIYVNVVNKVFVYIAGVLVLFIILIMVYDVILRNFFNAPTAWSLDLARFMMVYVFFLALGPALSTGHHVSLELFQNKVNDRVKKIMQILVYLITMIFGFVLLGELAISTWEVFTMNRLFPTTVSIPMIYVYLITPIGTLQLILTAISELLQSLSLTKTNSVKKNDNHLAEVS